MPSADEGDLLRGLLAGADDCLSLPFSFADLLTRLRAWTDPPAEEGGRTTRTFCLVG
jgi:DNA-binding response OmpR family regulator